MWALAGSPSGNPMRKHPKNSLMDMNDEEDQYKLLQAIAQGKALTSPSRYKPKDFTPLFKHPLPVSDHSSFHEVNLRRATCCILSKQAQAAITLGDAWVLEECFMNGAPINVSDKSGFTPMHLAVQRNSFDCIMVLINCGANVNAVTLSGVTPLFLALAAGSTQAAQIIRENGGLEHDDIGEAPAVPCLENSPKKQGRSIIDQVDKASKAPSRYTLF